MCCKYLQLFSFICMMCFDVYVKKQIIENLIDLQAEEREKKETGKKKK